MPGHYGQDTGQDQPDPKRATEVAVEEFVKKLIRGMDLQPLQDAPLGGQAQCKCRRQGYKGNPNKKLSDYHFFFRS